MADRPVTLDELIAELQTIQAAGHGACPVFAEYDCDYLPVHTDEVYVTARSVTDDDIQSNRFPGAHGHALVVLLGDASHLPGT